MKPALSLAERNPSLGPPSALSIPLTEHGFRGRRFHSSSWSSRGERTVWPRKISSPQPWREGAVSPSRAQDPITPVFRERNVLPGRAAERGNPARAKVAGGQPRSPRRRLPPVSLGSVPRRASLGVTGLGAAAGAGAPAGPARPRRGRPARGMRRGEATAPAPVGRRSGTVARGPPARGLLHTPIPR